MPRVNVMVVSFDALRADHLGLYGYPRPTSPNLDTFAAGALVFDHAWSAAQATPTSFAAMFTGLLPSRVFRGWRMADGPTMASAFAGAGYATAFVSSNVQLVAARNFGQGFARYEILTGNDQNDLDHDGAADDDEVLAEAVAWLREELPRPFFLWVHFLNPHSPYFYRHSSRELYDEGYQGKFEETTGHSFRVESDADLARVRDLYDGEILYVDRLFGELHQTLVTEGLLDDTLVVVTSDHGEELMDHGGLQHATVHEEIVHVPLIIRHPLGRGGRRVSEPVSTLDLLPTFAAVAGFDLAGPVDGVSLLAPLDAGRLRLAIAMTHQTDNYLAANEGADKAIADCHLGGGSFYDLVADPGENNDLVRDRRGRFRELVRAAQERLGEAPCKAIEEALRGGAEGTGLDAATQSQLLALGYLQGGAAAAGRHGDEVIWAEPNPIQICDGLRLGATVLHWNVAQQGDYDVRVGKVDGQLLAQGSAVGGAATGRWVKDGMEFFLVATGDGRVVASTKVELTRKGCPGYTGEEDDDEEALAESEP